MKIAIVGVGGIGSNVAVNLVRSGITWLRIIDFDRVEPSNLNRQFYFYEQIGRHKVEALAENLRRIQPELHIETITAKINAENCCLLLADCNLIVEGLDQAADKKILLEKLGNERLIVSACGIAGMHLDNISSRQIGNCHISGDFITACGVAPLYAHKVCTVANHMTAYILHVWSEQHANSAG